MATTTTTTQAPTQPGTQSYTYQPGDSYWGLASQYGGGGVNWGQIQALNPNLDPRNVAPGTQINLPSNWTIGGSNTPQSSSSQLQLPGNFQLNDLSNFAQSVPNNPTDAMNLISQQVGDLGKSQQNQLNYMSTLAPSLESAYNVQRQQGASDINTINQEAGLQQQNLSQQLGTGEQTIAATAGVQQQNLQQQEAAATGNAAAAAIARGQASNDPFVQTQKAAAGQPYEQALNQLNVQTQAQMAQLFSNYMGQSTNVSLNQMDQVRQINDQIAALAPQEVQQIANLNLNIAQTQNQMQEGIISNELGAYKIDSANALKEQQIQATLQAAQIKASATLGAAQLRFQGQQANAAGYAILGYDKNGTPITSPTLASQTAQANIEKTNLANAQSIVNNILKQQGLDKGGGSQEGGLFGTGIGFGAPTGQQASGNWDSAQNQLYQELKSGAAANLPTDMQNALWASWRQMDRLAGNNPGGNQNTDQQAINQAFQGNVTLP